MVVVSLITLSLRDLTGIGIRKLSFPRKREPAKRLAKQSKDGASFDKLRTNDLLVYLSLSALRERGMLPTLARS